MKKKNYEYMKPTRIHVFFFCLLGSQSLIGVGGFGGFLEENIEALLVVRAGEILPSAALKI